MASLTPLPILARSLQQLADSLAMEHYPTANALTSSLASEKVDLHDFSLDLEKNGGFILLMSFLEASGGKEAGASQTDISKPELGNAKRQGYLQSIN